MAKDEISNIEHPSAKDLLSNGTIIPSNANFGDLLRIMHTSHLSAVIIAEGDPVEYYIITHTDIIAFLYNFNLKQKIRTREEGISTRDYKKVHDLNAIPLSSLMTGPIEILDEDLPIDIIIREMANKGYKRVLVGKGKQPSGIIKMEDILSWNNAYFKASKPLMVLIIDNNSSVILGKHAFIENVHKEMRNDLIELFGGAMQSISAITEEIFNQSGEMRIMRKDNYTILFEPREKVTGIVVCDSNSIQLRRRLHFFTNNFCFKYNKMLKDKRYINSPKEELDISELAKVFIGK